MAPSLIDRFYEGDIRALGRLLTLVENRHPESGRILAELFPKSGNAFRIGLTGAPGAGKSTLVNQLAQQYATHDASVAVLAVDPTSPFTGGALLGDRIRFESTGQPVQGHLPVFFRSAASRGHTGGLARATEEMGVVLEAFGYLRILIESVGVGQVGLDIAQACDTTVVVVVPESGDDIQALKAGLLEIADIIVVNKADRPGAQTLRDQLQEAVHYRSSQVHGGQVPPILMTEGTRGVGVPELQQAIEAHREARQADGGADQLRRERMRQALLNLVREELREAAGRSFEQGFLPDGSSLEQALDAILKGDQNPFQRSGQSVSKLFPHLPPSGA